MNRGLIQNYVSGVSDSIVRKMSVLAVQGNNHLKKVFYKKI